MPEQTNPWRIESFLYAWINTEGMRENPQIEKTFCLGNNHSVDVKLNNFVHNPLSNQSIVKTTELGFSLNFRKEDKKWFRVDNDSVGFLHFHKDNFSNHQKLEEKYKVSELISFAFDWAYKIIKENFPEEIIKDGEGFTGVA